MPAVGPGLTRCVRPGRAGSLDRRNLVGRVSQPSPSPARRARPRPRRARRRRRQRRRAGVGEGPLRRRRPRRGHGGGARGAVQRHAGRELPARRLGHPRGRRRRRPQRRRHRRRRRRRRRAQRHDHGPAPRAQRRRLAAQPAPRPVGRHRRHRPLGEDQRGATTRARSGSPQTVTQSLGIPINHYVEVNFAGFTKHGRRDRRRRGVRRRTWPRTPTPGSTSSPAARSSTARRRWPTPAPATTRSGSTASGSRTSRADLGRIERQQLFIRTAVDGDAAEDRERPVLDRRPHRRGDVVGHASTRARPGPRPPTPSARPPSRACRPTRSRSRA